MLRQAPERRAADGRCRPRSRFPARFPAAAPERARCVPPVAFSLAKVEKQLHKSAVRLFSLTAEYALRALIWLAREPQRARTAREVAVGTGIPPHYLTKVLQALARTGLVTAHRGVGGGFRIGQNPSKISVLEVLHAVEPWAFSRAPGTGSAASGQIPDDALAATGSRIEAILAETTLAQLLAGGAPGAAR